MGPFDVRGLRRTLRLSRADLARFLGVSDVTVTRWETGGQSEPRGLQGVLLGAVVDALAAHPAESIGRLIRSSGADHRGALAQLIRAASDGSARNHSARLGSAPPLSSPEHDGSRPRSA